MIEACFVNSLGCFSWKSSPKIPELTTSWCLNWQTVWINAFINDGAFQLWAAIYCLLSFLRTRALHYMVNWRPFTSIWTYPHSTAYCFLFLLLPVLLAICKSGFRVICLVTGLAASMRTRGCQCVCCVPRIPVLDIPPAHGPEFEPHSPGRGGCVFMMCWCGIGEEDNNERQWEALRTI